jgi:hypothetical protein
VAGVERAVAEHRNDPNTIIASLMASRMNARSVFASVS